jgi:hypothetical protein
MKYIFILFFLYSCSATHHINKAIKKDPTILQEKTVIDTVEIVRLDSVPYIINDTIRYKLIEKRTDTIIEFKYKYIKEPLTRQDKRIKHKEIKQVEDNKLELSKYAIKTNAKTLIVLQRLQKRIINTKERQSHKFNYWWFVLFAFIIGVMTRLIKVF